MDVAAPAPRTRQFVDIHEQAAELRGFDQDYRQMSRGAFSGEFTTVELGLRSGIFVETVNQAIESRGGVPQGEVGMAFLIAGARPLRFGHQTVSLNQAVFLNSGAEIDCLMPQGTKICVATVPSEVIAADLPKTFSRSSVQTFTPAASELARLRATAIALSRPATRKTKQGSDRLIGNMRGCLFADIHVQGPNAGARIFRDMRDTILEHPNQSLSVASMAAMQNVSRRTLEYVFRASSGVGPREYSELMKLNAIRRELQVSNDTIGDIAARYGIWHLGRFAQTYRRTFGELPSQTRTAAARSNARDPSP